ncbi:hypothetical protein V6N11_010034 [Hibiscus sabdariffa]|uniref:Reverse transcriptase zinc-binding domain-containing protein n=1 Tax=Hibiscus sabdariffa TaxID=183260 RepID=A0ABR2PDW9_9ROSI
MAVKINLCISKLVINGMRPQTPSEAFGPWMVMEKKHRRTNKQTKPANPQTQDNDFLVPNQLMPMLRALVTTSCPESITRVSCTSLWRALSSYWSELCAGIAWSIGNGSIIRPLDDVWVPSLGPDSFFPEPSLSDLLDSEGNWDRGKLAEYFTIDALPHILSIKSPDPTDIDDFIIWRWNPKHVFKTKSAYFRLASSSWDFTNPCWADIWKTRVPQRLRLFLWIAFRDRLMTNLERCRRSVGHHPYCTTCDTHDESTLHILRDCKFAREVWLYFLPGVYSPIFFTESLQAWLLSNIHCHALASEYSIPWSTIFISILWQLWKARNEHVFNSIPQSPIDVWHKGIFWARCYMESFLPPLIRPPDSRSLQWLGPEPGWIQSDCAEAVKLIKADNAYMSPISLVRAIATLRRKAWGTEITWIPRTSNLPADMLAKSVDPKSTEFHELAEPPVALMPLLSMDALHLSL